MSSIIRNQIGIIFVLLLSVPACSDDSTSPSKDLGPGSPDKSQTQTDSTMQKDTQTGQPDKTSNPDTATHKKCTVWADWECTPTASPPYCEAKCVTEENEIYEMWIYEGMVGSCRPGTSEAPIACPEATFSGDSCSGCENTFNGGCCKPE